MSGVKREKSAYAHLRDMEAGQTIFLPYEKWNAARSAASYLREAYGAYYEVNIVLPGREEVMVTRKV